MGDDISNPASNTILMDSALRILGDLKVSLANGGSGSQAAKGLTVNNLTI